MKLYIWCSIQVTQDLYVYSIELSAFIQYNDVDFSYGSYNNYMSLINNVETSTSIYHYTASFFENHENDEQEKMTTEEELEFNYLVASFN